MVAEKHPLISVCIPAYKHPEYLKRLLESLVWQSYRQFEVIVTDDSPDDSVKRLVDEYASQLDIYYHKNTVALGTPGNWNAAIGRARGKWIKLIHDDDWLASPNSLHEYVRAISANPSAHFIFSAYLNVNTSNTNQPVFVSPGKFRLKQLEKDPVTLLSKNIIGPPSVVIHRNEHQHLYDVSLKWLVDMDFYIRYLRHHSAVYVDKPLVNIGLNELQVTKSSALVREVEIPEHFIVLEKTGVSHLRNLLIYDAWWRLFRNLQIRHASEIRAAGYDGPIPSCLLNMIAFQQRFSYKVLKFGPAAKSLMMASYTYNLVTGGFKRLSITK